MSITPQKTKKISHRQIKDILYEQVARIGKAASSPKRLELLELLCQGEMNVEQLALEAQISVKLTSAHLGVLKSVGMVNTRRAGKNIFYRLSDINVANFWVNIRSLAENRLHDLQVALRDLVSNKIKLAPIDRNELLRDAANGKLVVIDVRTTNEYNSGHLPFARSIPLSELKQRMIELPTDKTIVAYCRGPFCLLANEAVNLLEKSGHRAIKLDDGVAEWQSLGFLLSN